MKFTFIHTADIHLDSPLVGLGAYSQELADCFREASRHAFVNLVDAAIEREVAFVVIAGDIFDGDWKDYTTGLFFVKQMARLDREGIPVYAIRGNHDAATEITKSLPYPDNVRFFDTKKPETITDNATGAVLHGQGFHDRWSGENIALEYPSPDRGAFNIGVLHTACEGAADHANYAPCTVEQLRNHGYDYWALGHVHGFAVLCDDPYIVYPGNLQGRHARECGAKGFCVVEVNDGEVGSFEHIACDVARWCDVSVLIDDDCRDFNTLLDLIRREVEDAAPDADGKPMAVRLTLTGATSLNGRLISGQSELRADIEAVLLSIADEIMLEKLRLKTTEPATAEATNEEHQDLVMELLGEMDASEMTTALDGELDQYLATLRGKLPGKEDIIPDEDELTEIIAEARSMVAARLTQGVEDSREN